MGNRLSTEEQTELENARNVIRELQLQLDAGTNSMASSMQPAANAMASSMPAMASSMQSAANASGYTQPPGQGGNIIFSNTDYVMKSDGSNDMRTLTTSLSCTLSPASCGPNTKLENNQCIVDPDQLFDSSMNDHIITYNCTGYTNRNRNLKRYLEETGKLPHQISFDTVPQQPPT